METPLDASGTTTTASSPSREKVISKGSETLEKRTRPIDAIMAGIMFFCGIVSIFTTIGIVVILGQETTLFFGSEAYVPVRAPVVSEAEPTINLTEPIDENETTLSVSFEGSRIPYDNNQFVQIGSETMQITDRGQRTITVNRGMDGTEQIAHETEETIFGMVEERVALTEEISPEDTVLPIQEDFGREFDGGERLQLGEREILRVVEVNPSSLVVERGLDGTEARAYETGEVVTVAKPTNIFDFLTGTLWRPTIGDFGVLPLLVATLEITLVALLVATPLGLGAAIYLSEYATPRVRGTLKPILEILAGVPTVVYGFFALTFMSPLLRGIFGDQVQFQNMLSAGLVVGVLIIPYVSSIAEDALAAVPRALREASYGLGATKLETTLKVVLPAAASGITAAFVIAAARAVGETMIVTMAAGSLPNLTFNFFTGAETITGHIARISGGDLSYNSIQYNSIFAIGATLFIMTLALNIIGNFIIRRLREEY